MRTTKEQVGGAIQVIAAIANAIRELGRVPSGELYARVMGQVSLEQYDRILGILKGAELIEVKNHEITWIGGAL